MITPRSSPTSVLTAKLRSRKMAKRTNGCLVVSTCTANRNSPSAASPASTLISVEWNQSSVWPRSSTIWNAPSPSASSAKPNRSNGRGFSSRVSGRNVVIPAKAATPTGRLIRKTQCHEKFSVSQPPSSGPISGPRIKPSPKIAIARPRSSGGLRSIRITCAIGIIDAPNIPCKKRKTTSSSSRTEIPQSPETTVNPTTETSSNRLRP